MRDEIDSGQRAANSLILDDYAWEMAGGGEGIDLATVPWNEDFGYRVSIDELRQGYLVELMEALRDVEARLAQTRSSPLQQILNQREIPDAEQEALVGLLRSANQQINESQTVRDIGTDLSSAFLDAAGTTYAMEVRLGLGEPSFNDVSRGLRVLLSGFGIRDLDPGRNGLGLNNILHISMLSKYFERRITNAKTAGQLLLVEEPEAHLHPQLQRVLLSALARKDVQVFVTTHSTHITSGTALSSQIVLTNGGTSQTTAVLPGLIPALDATAQADLERYLDATRGTLLFARGVMLVEGPAELFIIPPLVKQVMGIDLDEEGISVIPIYGTHFAAYARLFGPNAINKKCAIVADGDLKPSDATAGNAGLADNDESSSNPGVNIGSR